jgi:hypothetical protein
MSSRFKRLAFNVLITPAALGFLAFAVMLWRAAMF